MAERRENPALRDQGRDWHQALLRILSANHSAGQLATSLGAWATLEEVMAKAPKLLPHVLDLCWHFRHTNEMRTLFEDTDGSIVEAQDAALNSTGKTFKDAVVYHLQGAVRVYCETREIAWLANERTRINRLRPPNRITMCASSKHLGQIGA